MPTPNVGLRWVARNASQPEPALKKILQRGIQSGAAVLVALLVAVNGVAVLAQETRPQIVPGERKPKSRRSTGPRAVAVLQMSASGKISLVPIAILINGKFWDATAYKADPIPMALDYGTIYEAERTGNSLGLFIVGSALRRNSTATGQAPWIGTGTFRANGAEPEKQPAKANPVPVGIDLSEGPPRLTRDPSAGNKPPDSAAPASKGSSPNAPPSDSPKSTGTSGSGDEPPRLHKPTPPSGSEPSQPPDTGAKAPGDS